MGNFKLQKIQKLNDSKRSIRVPAVPLRLTVNSMPFLHHFAVRSDATPAAWVRRALALLFF